jgi:threonine dehydratase
MRSPDAKTGADVRLMPEHLQRMGSFKTYRTCDNQKKVTTGDCEAFRAVAVSAGNHAS